MIRRLDGNILVLATHNAGKVAEIMPYLSPFGLTIKTLNDFNLPAPEETGVTFLENATLKARAAAQATNLPALADDSGFCLQALDNAPGVYTADWATAADGSRDYFAAMAKINNLLKHTPNKSAAFVATLVLAWPDGHVEYAEGRVDGTFVFPPRGALGFGYDPCFVPQGQSQTFAELGPDFKKTCSHRARALEAIVAKCIR